MSWAQRLKETIKAFRGFDWVNRSSRRLRPFQFTDEVESRVRLEIDDVIQNTEKFLASTSNGVAWAAMSILENIQRNSAVILDTGDTARTARAAVLRWRKQLMGFPYQPADIKYYESRLLSFEQLVVNSAAHDVSITEAYPESIQEVFRDYRDCLNSLDCCGAHLSPGSGTLPLIRSMVLAQKIIPLVGPPNSRDFFSRTPLHVALYHDAITHIEPDMVTSEVAEHMDDRGVTPLHLTSIHGHVNIARLLLAAGARVDTPSDGDLMTSLHYAAFHGKAEITQYFLGTMECEKQAIVNSTDSYGNTPIALAAENGHDGVVTLLLAHGAEGTIPDGKGETPLQKAERGWHERTAACLRLSAEKATSLRLATDTGLVNNQSLLKPFTLTCQFCKRVLKTPSELKYVVLIHCTYRQSLTEVQQASSAAYETVPVPGARMHAPRRVQYQL